MRQLFKTDTLIQNAIDFLKLVNVKKKSLQLMKIMLEMSFKCNTDAIHVSFCNEQMLERS